MSTPSARTRLARTLRDHTRRQVGAEGRTTHYAVVRQVVPLQVELAGSGLLLPEDDLVVTQWVRRYGYDYGLKVGDTVLVSHMQNDDFVVHDVVATGKIEDGLDLAATASSGDITLTDPQGGAITQNHHIIKKVPFRDTDGVVIGQVAIYGSLP